MKKKSILVGAMIAGAFITTTNASNNYSELGNGNDVRENLMTVKGSDALDKFAANLTCGEGKCGEATEKASETPKAADKSVEHKCGEGKCGEGKCGETSEKADKKADKKAAAKSADKSVEHKCGEGKCGEGKCGEK